MDRASASRPIPAPRTEVFRIVSDARGHVAIDASGMLLSAPGNTPMTKVGDTFRIRMDREALGDRPFGKYEVLCTVTRFEADRLVEWNVTDSEQARPPFGHVFGYELADNDDGTTQVTSYCDWSGVPEDRKPPGVWPLIPDTSLRNGLGILERTVINQVPLDLFG